MIVQELYKIQNRHGYLPRVELEGLAQRLAGPYGRVLSDDDTLQRCAVR